MMTWTDETITERKDKYWIGLEESTDSSLSFSIYGQPTQIQYSDDLRAAIAITKLKPYSFKEPHKFCHICLETSPAHQVESYNRNQSWLYYLKENEDANKTLLDIAGIIEDNRDNHNEIITRISESVPTISTPTFTSEADGPFYDTEETPYHSHTPSGLERNIEASVVAANFQYKHSSALKCSKCGRTSNQPEPSSTLHLVTSETLSPIRPHIIGASYWVCNEHEIKSLSAVPHLPENRSDMFEMSSEQGAPESDVGSHNYADEHLLVKCNLEWLDMGHPRGEMGVLTCREPEIIDQEPIIPES